MGAYTGRMGEKIPLVPPALLFTAFEPSGDQLAAPVIAQLRAAHPERPIYAIGGPRMQAAGATLIEQTGEHAVMLLGALSHAMEHRRRIKRLAAWLKEHPVAGHIPVDSPAANWALCKLIRTAQPTAKIMHLVTPQIWAWGGWRINKLRKLTDHVLCILPFEPAWLKARGVKGTFIGHPLYTDLASTIQEQPKIELPDGAPKLALLPGSRSSEHQRNWPMMAQVFADLKAKHTGLTGIVAAIDDVGAERLKALVPTRWPEGLHLRVGAVNDVLRWCDAAIVVSGTATLHTAVFQKPMVAVYNVSGLTWNLLGRWLVSTRTFTLPNLLAQGPEARGRDGWIIPEFVPHFGNGTPVTQAMDRLLSDADERAKQVSALKKIGEPFLPLSFAQRAAEVIQEEIEPRH